MNHPARETADNPAFRSRETRADTPNPLHRVVYAGAQSNRFSILRAVRTDGRKSFIHFGSYGTLQAAIEARDSLPEFMRPGEKFRLKENEE